VLLEEALGGLTVRLPKVHYQGRFQPTAGAQALRSPSQVADNSLTTVSLSTDRRSANSIV
jgi:hypothetical protein